MLQCVAEYRKLKKVIIHLLIFPFFQALRSLSRFSYIVCFKDQHILTMFWSQRLC